MKTILVSTIILTTFSLFTFLPHTAAEDIITWSLPEGAIARLGKGSVSEIAYSPDGTRLAVASSIGIWMYDTETFEEIGLLTGHTYDVYTVAFSPDGTTLASGSEGTIRLWDAHTGEYLHTLYAADWDHYSLSLSFSPDGATLANGSYDKIELWDMNTYGFLHTLEMDSGGGRVTGSVAFSPDGTTLASGSGVDNYLRLWDVETGDLLHTFEGHTRVVSSVAFSPDGTTLASGSEDGTIRLWDTETSKHLDTLEGHSGEVNSITYSPDGTIIASGSSDGIRLWDAETGDLTVLAGIHISALEGRIGWNNNVVFSPDGTTLAGSSWDGTIRFWDMETGEPIQNLEGFTSSVKSVTFSPDGTTLASGSPDGTRLWNVETGEHLHTLTGHTSWVNSVTFSTDGTIIASGSYGEIFLWDAETGEHLRTLIGDRRSVSSLAFSPDGKTLASGSEDGAIYLWDVETGEVLYTLIGHVRSVDCIAFSPDGKTIASGSDREIGFWDVNAGTYRRTLTNIRYPKAFSPDWRTIASSTSGGLYLSDAETGEHLHTLTGHVSWVSSAAFSPDGKTLASGGEDGTVLLWDITPYIPEPVEQPTDTGIPRIRLSDLESYDLTSVPYLWMVARTEGRGGAAAINRDSLADASGGVVTEADIAVNGAVEGDVVGGLTWTVAQIDGLIDDLSSQIGGGRDDHSSYALIVLESNTALSGVTMGVSSDDAIKVWMNGEVVHINAVDRSALSPIDINDYQDYFEVDLKEGDNLLLVKVSEGGGAWRMYVGIDIEDIKTRSVLTDVNDVNKDGTVNILDLVVVAGAFGQTGENVADVNGDGIVNILDLVAVAAAFGEVAAAPFAIPQQTVGQLTSADVQHWLTQAQAFNLTDPTSLRGIRFLQQLLAALTPKETVLLANYPNPFNPETWIPYQLATPADVTVTIYTADGKLVRTLDLGHQLVGIYQSRNSAAHWDGKNAVGETVASGMYFYTLKAGDFSATRKMLIKK